MTRRAVLAVLATMVLCALALGCALRSGPALDAGAMRMEVDPEGELPPRFWDSFDLMQKGAAAFEAQRWDEALLNYQTLLEKFPDLKARPLAEYNAAVCLSKLGRPDDAIAMIRMIEREPGPGFSPSVLLDLEATVDEDAQRWADAEAVLARMAALFNIEESERIDAYIRLGIVQYEMDRLGDAKISLREGLERYKELTKKHLAVATGQVSKGYFFLGEIYFRQFQAVPLSGQGEELKRQLNAKADLLVLARAQYVHCIQTYDLWWISASLHKLGLGYETFYFDILNAPLPSDLTPEQRDVYVRKLEERVSNVIKKSVESYSRNVELDRENRLSSPWAKQSFDRLEVLREYLRTHEP